MCWFCFIAGKTVNAVLDDLLAIHRDMVIVDGRSLSLNVPQNVKTKEGVMEAAAVCIMLGAYRNQLMPSLAQPALVALSFCGLKVATKGMAERKIITVIMVFIYSAP